MRPSFLLDLNCTPVSSLINNDQSHALALGTEVALARPFDNEYGTIPAGSRGIVSDVDETEGIIEITMSHAHAAVYLWHNKLILVPFQTDDLASALICWPAVRPGAQAEQKPSGTVTHLRKA